MNDALTALYDNWVRPSYEARVRGTVYLWGSATLTQNLNFSHPPVLHVRNDLFGEPIKLGTRVAAGTAPGSTTPYGTLQPGECASIQLQGIAGVYADCALESVVSCIIN
jgi:hypothetical protein